MEKLDLQKLRLALIQAKDLTKEHLVGKDEFYCTMISIKEINELLSKVTKELSCPRN
jgi:hypothetical protein